MYNYQYDKAFNLVNIDDARWNRTQYRYNANDQIVETQYSNQFECQSEKFQYDNNLNITEHQLIPSDAQGAFLQLAKQQKGRVTRRINAKGYQDYHYDINGRLTQKVVHQHGFRAKTWYYQWNALNQLVACFNPGGECWRYTYDAFGRRLSKSKVVDNRPIPLPPIHPLKINVFSVLITCGLAIKWCKKPRFMPMSHRLMIRKFSGFINPEKSLQQPVINVENCIMSSLIIKVHRANFLAKKALSAGQDG
ncbi:hypothetical protein LG402_15800 [Proteus sp. NMG38-2]|nr:hypothetical protein LG402_15800 [Proteus sp. NMG38-2]